MQAGQPVIWTIGHSTRTIEEFIALLRSFGVAQVADVRHFPGSRKFPHFNAAALGISLSQAGIGYEHIASLGGRRKAEAGSPHTAWRHPAFRGYADYMQTPPFHAGILRLEQLAAAATTAYMCSEAVWWRCHRSMISDLLKVRGWAVRHIMDLEKAKEHPFTAPAKIVNGQLTYLEP